MQRTGRTSHADESGPVRRRRIGALAAAAGLAPAVLIVAGPTVASAGNPARNHAQTGPVPAAYDGGSSRTNLCAPPPDTVPPQVSSVTFSPSAVDVTSGPQTLQVTAGVSDQAGAGVTPTGVRHVTVSFAGPRSYFTGRLELTSGTATDGTWQGTVTVPSSVRSGTYHLSYVTAQDGDRNLQVYGRGGRHANAPTDIRLQSGWDDTLTVTAPPPPKTQRPGRLTGFSLHPSTVDAREAAGRVRVSATLSGPAPRIVSVRFSNSGRGRHYLNVGARLHPTGEGVYRGRVRIGRWLGKTTARASLFASYDYAKVRPPYLSYSAQRLHRAGYPTTLKILSGVDQKAPVLTSLTVSPASLDSTTAPATATITATAADVGSGVRSIYVNAAKRHRPYGFAATRLHRDGDSWTGTLKFPACGAGGTYQLNLSVVDAARNYSQYSHKRLLASDFPASLHVTSHHGDVQPPRISGATALAANGEITVTFSEGVHNVSTSTLTLYPMAPADSRYQQPAGIAGIVCSDGSATVDCSGSAQPVTSAVLSVPGLTAGSTYQLWANLRSATPQLTDAAGNPMEWGYPAVAIRAS